jgi:hypothetical protein
LLSETIAQRADEPQEGNPGEVSLTACPKGYLPYLDNAPDCGGQEIAVLIGYH